ncbi:HET-domain-containing protein [Stipitochalara longipes BDJ]|nr:HET-domain-containing protein [Stipitochalara longipes BDJ]
MDYTNLAISDRQIRLITILPPSRGASDHGDTTIRCEMAVREQPLPTSGPLDAGLWSPDYISFDHCLTSVPNEWHVHELRQMLAPTLQKLDRYKSNRWRKARDKLQSAVLGNHHDPQENSVAVPAHLISGLLGPDEKLWILDLQRRPGVEIRVWDDSIHLETFDDTSGMGMYVGEKPPPEHTALLPHKKLNPFFRMPGSNKTTTRERPQGHPSDNYVALSYAWGPLEPTAEIMVNGRAVQVRANLEAALRQFTTMDYFSRGGKIWIDSLCVNQEDEAEKQVQVQMMASIYSHAGNVMVWLGVETEDSDLAISYLEMTGNDYRAEYAEAMDETDAFTATNWRTMAQVRMEVSYDDFRKANIADSGWLDHFSPALYDFFDRPYWRRLWIIQELCFGRAGMPVVCGKRVTQWRYIRDGILKYTSILDLIDEVTQEKLMSRDEQPPREQSLLHVAQIAQLEIAGHKKKLPLVPKDKLYLVVPTFFENGPLLGSAIRRAIALASQSACSVPHDRIYGMLQILGLPDLGIQVDYSKRLVDVFVEFSTAIGILEGEWHAGGRVPLSCYPPVIGEQGYLICRGKVVDEVDGVGAMSRADIELGGMQFPDGDDGFTALSQPKNTGEDSTAGRDPMIYDVLVGGSGRMGEKAPESFNCLYHAFPVEEPPKNSPFYRSWHFLHSSADFLVNGRPLASYFSHMALPSDPNLTGVDKMSTAAARQAMTARTKMRRLIVTKSGLLGLAPVQTQPGDAVIAIAGYGKPVIARKVDTIEGQDFWYLIGEAYVRGMMNSEKLQLSTKPWYYQTTQATEDTMEFLPFV